MALQNSAYVGLKAFPERGSKQTRYVDVKFRATVFKHDQSSFTLNVPGNESNTGRGTNDLIAVNVSKTIGQVMGGYSLTLVPRTDYLRLIDPGDWALIESDNGDGSGYIPLMYGPISSVRQTRTVTEKGAHATLIRISGNDFGKVLASTTAIYDSKLANDPAFTNLGLASVANGMNGISGAPDRIVIETLRTFLSTNLQQWFDPRTGAQFGTGDTSLLTHYIEDTVLGNTVVLPFTLNASLWQVLQQWANLSINELFIDYRPPWVDQTDFINLVPAVVLRQCPYSGDAWNNLTAVFVERNECISEDIGKDDADVRNFIRAVDDPSITGFQDGMQVYMDKAGIVNPESIKKFGFRRHEPPTQYVFDWQSQIPRSIPDVVIAHTGLLAQWHHSNEKLLSGTLELYHRPDVRVGYRLDYYDIETNELMQFYLEGVQHALTYPGRSTTTLSVTRGRNSNDPDTNQLFSQTLDVLHGRGILEQLGNTIDRSLSALSNTAGLRKP